MNKSLGGGGAFAVALLYHPPLESGPSLSCPGFHPWSLRRWFCGAGPFRGEISQPFPGWVSAASSLQNECVRRHCGAFGRERPRVGVGITAGSGRSDAVDESFPNRKVQLHGYLGRHQGKAGALYENSVHDASQVANFVGDLVLALLEGFASHQDRDNHWNRRNLGYGWWKLSSGKNVDHVTLFALISL